MITKLFLANHGFGDADRYKEYHNIYACTYKYFLFCNICYSTTFHHIHYSWQTLAVKE